MSEELRSHTHTRKEETAKTAAKTFRTVPSQIDLFAMIDDIWWGFCRHWLGVLLMASIFSSVFYWWGKHHVTPIYEANCTFLVNTSSSINYSNNYYSTRAANQIAKTFPYIIKNDALQDIIEEDLGVTEVPGTITATALPETNMMTVSVRSEEGQLSYDILQSILNNYGEIARAVMGETDLTIMNESGVPLFPVNLVGGRRYALYGFLGALLLWGTWFAVQSYFKKTIRQQDDFTKLFNIKCLGSTPRVRAKKRTRKKSTILVTDEYVSYGFVEGIRTLRTRIEREHADSGAKVFLISSALAGEGKTTIAANLALSLADKGLKVILMDMDFRNSSVLKVLGREEAQRGILEVLAGKTSVERVTIKDDETGLIILPAGHEGSSTAESVNSEKLSVLFDIVRNMADYVIVDTPPSSILSDAASLSKHADEGIFIVRQDFAPVERIKEGLDLLTDSGLKIAGCMLNYAEAGITSYAYGYGYGYGYGRYGRYGRRYGSYERSHRSRREREKNEEII